MLLTDKERARAKELPLPIFLSYSECCMKLNLVGDKGGEA